VEGQPFSLLLAVLDDRRPPDLLWGHLKSVHTCPRGQGTSSQFRAWLPVITVLAGVVAATWSVLQYFGDQRFKTRASIEERFGEGLEAISDYPESGHSTSSRVVRALAELEQLVPLSNSPEQHMNAVTDVVAVAVRHDVDFDNLQQARLDGLCLSGWPGYVRWLEQNPQERAFILYRYRQAFRALAERHETYFETMRLGPSGYLVDEYISEQDYLHFIALADGYRQHMARIPSGPDRDAAIAAVGDVLRNQQLANSMFTGRQP
jgi:hypothetical protein